MYNRSDLKFARRRLPVQDWVFVFPEGYTFGAHRALYGADRAVAEVARHCVAKYQIRVTFLAQEGASGVGVCGQESVHATSLKEQADWIRDRVPDVVVGVSTGEIFAFARGNRNVIYQHNPTVIGGVPRFGRELYARVQGIVVVSEDAQRRQQAMGAPAQKIRVVRNGVDLKTFRPAGVVRRRNRLLSVGNIVDYKGIDVVLQAFQAIRGAVPDAELHLYGANLEFVSEDVWNPARAWMQERAFLGDDRRIDWARVEAVLPGVRYMGEATSPELSSAYQHASLLVSGTRIPETFGIVSLEAQACGCIPVLPNHGGMPETIRPGVTGKLYVPCDSEDLARAILELLGNDEALSAKRILGSEWVSKEFSWHRTAEDFVRQVRMLPQYRLQNEVLARFGRTAKHLRQLCGIRPSSKTCP